MGRQTKKLIAAAGALALAVASISAYISWSRSRGQLLELLDEFGTGFREPGVVSDVRREPDAVHARLLTARALLADELDRRWLADLNDAEREAAEALSLRKLESAGSLARRVLRSRPADWQARMILAGSTYLEMSRLGDPRRWRERKRWEQPLLDAMAMATSKVEPRRILAAAYLNDWSLMATSERAAARELLRDAFRDLETLEQLFPTWLRRAESLDQTFDLIPADLSSWQYVERYFRVRRDWERTCEARTRTRIVLPSHLDKTLAEAERRLAGGDKGMARSLTLSALWNTPIGPDHVDTLDRLLRTLPPGPILPRHQQRMRAWLAWTRGACLLSRCPVSKATIQRLRALSQYETSADRAWVAEMAGDTYAADSHARDAFVPNTPNWTPYLLLKAKRLATAGETSEAVSLLAMIDPEWEVRAVTRAVAKFVRKDVGAAPAGEFWQSPEIFRMGENSFREYSWAEPPRKIRLLFASSTSVGSAVDILWSDRLTGCYPVESGAVITLTPPQTAGVHRLEVRPLVGTRAGLLATRAVP